MSLFSSSVEVPGKIESRRVLAESGRNTLQGHTASKGPGVEHTRAGVMLGCIELNVVASRFSFRIEQTVSRSVENGCGGGFLQNETHLKFLGPVTKHIEISNVETCVSLTPCSEPWLEMGEAGVTLRQR
ncbi:hypothetical protein F2Q68_00030601 [Brassica cretica]|uniref:Uncharacterized protein n=1 Tax=Brassica cretica TaxID=69181 RepID=A0A8S9GI84_BRACR|nr:hypothetical protein F2Q68_00030601 [Brassica cretica]